MAWNDSDDPLIAGLRLLIAERVNTALNATFGRDPIPTTYGLALPLELIPRTQLPALLVYRLGETYSDERPGRRYVLEVGIDWWGPDVPQKRLPTTWPMLFRVWRQVVLALESMVVPSSGDDLRTTVGIDRIRPETIRVSYAIAESGSTVYPFWSARMLVEYDPAAIESAEVLADFTSLLVQHDLWGEGALEYEDLVSQLETIP